MDTILKFSDFKNYNFKVTASIDEMDVNRIIFDVEQRFIKDLTNFYDYLKLNLGGAFDSILPDLKRGLASITYGFLLIENVQVSRFGAVKKNSNFSTQALRDEIEAQASSYFEVGCNLLRYCFDEVKKMETNAVVEKYPFYNWLRGFYYKKKLINN